jgi:hypothetical protein
MSSLLVLEELWDARLCERKLVCSLSCEGLGRLHEYTRCSSCLFRVSYARQTSFFLRLNKILVASCQRWMLMHLHHVCSSGYVECEGKVRRAGRGSILYNNCGAHIRCGGSTCARSSTCAGSVIRASEWSPICCPEFRSIAFCTGSLHCSVCSKVPPQQTFRTVKFYKWLLICTTEVASLIRFMFLWILLQ